MCLHGDPCRRRGLRLQPQKRISVMASEGQRGHCQGGGLGGEGVIVKATIIIHRVSVDTGGSRLCEAY